MDALGKTERDLRSAKACLQLDLEWARRDVGYLKSDLADRDAKYEETLSELQNATRKLSTVQSQSSQVESELWLSNFEKSKLQDEVKVLQIRSKGRKLEIAELEATVDALIQQNLLLVELSDLN